MFDFALCNITKILANKNLAAFHLAYFREGNRQYVNDLVLCYQVFIAEAMKNGAVIMICGSHFMQNDMTRIPETSFKERNNHKLRYYQSHNRILMGCY